jgi:YgiT-type zinc finger domain-containing protein
MGRLSNKEGKMMLSFEKCPVCGGELKEKMVEKILHGGNHAAVLHVNAEVCLHCGERLYTTETVRMFEKIRNKLKRQDLSGFNPQGQTFSVDKEWLNKARPSANNGA